MDKGDQTPYSMVDSDRKRGSRGTDNDIEVTRLVTALPRAEIDGASRTRHDVHVLIRAAHVALLRGLEKETTVAAAME